ncbi:class I SAM-dependent DNA methyltransferase [Arcanobacterium canis]
MPLLSPTQRKRAARNFAQKWAGRGYEKGDTSSFWLELLGDVIGMDDVTTNVRFEKATNTHGYIDVTIRDAKTVIEQKSLGVDLDKPEMRQGVMVTPFEQAKRYADSLRNSERPDTIIVCDFDHFRIHDLDDDHPAQNYLEFRLAELPEQLHLLDFLIDPQLIRRRREEKVSLDAGQLIGRLYDLLRAQYLDPDSPQSRHSLNVLCVRLVFLLFAEDAGLFAKDSFYHYLKNAHPSYARTALRDLFVYLKTPDADRDPYASDLLTVFPYVNGGLFEADVTIPNFSQEILDFLLQDVSQGTDWSEISPTIFGGVFESTLNPASRRAGGMHYTSPQNIHKLIDPLFLDDLKAELHDILNAPGVGDRKRRGLLKQFHNKIASLHFFDPACGSGNFLTETYIHLRKLENKILSELQNDQGVLALDDSISPLKVSLSQFHGIEINDFAVNVATTALWIAELQANAEAESIVYGKVQDFPLADKANIVHANALRTDWSVVVLPGECDYIIGNPPFIGYSRLSPEQKEDRLRIMGKAGGVLDYVACWFKLAADFMRGSRAQAALVSTNSIAQGQQVEPLWKPLFDDGVTINFAHRTFAWSNESTDAAHVHVVIVGFGYEPWEHKTLLTYSGGSVDVDHPANINAYLAPAPDVFVTKRSKPLSSVPAMAKGFQPTDGQNLILEPEERDHLLDVEPQSAKWIRPFSMGQEFINGKDRYCLWLADTTPAQLRDYPEVLKHVRANHEWRLAQVKTGDAYKLADRPHLLRPTSKFHDGTYIAIPVVTSSRREYIPLSFVDNGMIPGNQVYFIPTDSRFIFGILMSRAHNAWMRTIGGRLKSDYRYANTLVYNTFVFPHLSPAEEVIIAQAGQAVLDARALYPGATLADLYNPDNDWLYPELDKAHKALDAVVESAYGLTPGLDEKDIVAHLFTLYGEAAESAKA